jgi:hypothetical protein
VQGPTGGLGFTGSQGVLGLRGETGFVGSQGITGATGPAGGPTGPLGFTGSQGVAGFLGSTGFTGSIGFTGSQGAGFVGSQGTTGFTGSAGTNGTNGFVGSQGAGFTGSAGTVTTAADVPMNNVTVNGLTTIKQVQEALTVLNGVTGLVTHDYSLGTIFYHVSPAGNFTVQLTNYPATANVAGVVTLVLQQGSTARYATALSINGTTTLLKQYNGSVPTVRANKTDIQSITIYNVNGTINATSQVSTFG